MSKKAHSEQRSAQAIAAISAAENTEEDCKAVERQAALDAFQTHSEHSGLRQAVSFFSESSVSFSQIKQKHRVPDDVDEDHDDEVDTSLWTYIRKTAPGCRWEYFRDDADSIRIDFPHTKLVVAQPDSNPISLMKLGIMVMFHVHDEMGGAFVRKLFRVDDQLRFLFIAEQHYKHKKFQREAAQVISIALEKIREVYVLAEAQHACEDVQANIPKDVTLDQLVVLRIDDHPHFPSLDEWIPDRDKVVICSSHPQQKLKECLVACVEFAQGKSHSSDSDAHVFRVDDILLPDTDSLLNRDAEVLKYEVRFRGSGSVQPETVSMHGARQAAIDDTIQRLSASMFPVDLHRTQFVLQDALSLRACTVGIGYATIFKGGMREWISDLSNLERNVTDEMRVPDAVDDTKENLKGLELFQDEGSRYSDACSRAALAALLQYLRLELQAINLVHEMPKFHTKKSVEEPCDEDESGKPGPEASAAQSSRSTAVPSTAAPSSRSTARSSARSSHICPECGFVGHKDETRCIVCHAPEKGEAAVLSPFTSPEYDLHHAAKTAFSSSNQNLDWMLDIDLSDPKFQMVLKEVRAEQHKAEMLQCVGAARKADRSSDCVLQ